MRRVPSGRSIDPGVVAGGHGIEAEDLGPLAGGGRT